MLPLLARLCAAPHATLLTVNIFSMGLTGVGITVFLLSHLFLPYRLAKAAYSELLQLEVHLSEILCLFLCQTNVSVTHKSLPHVFAYL